MRLDSCLPSAARLDSPGDQGKGKVGPKKVLFLQNSTFFHRLPYKIHFLTLEGFVQPSNLKLSHLLKIFKSKFLGVPLKIAGRRPAIFQNDYFIPGNLLQYALG